MQDKKQQLELAMDQWNGAKLGKEYVKAVNCHPTYWTSMRSTSWGFPGGINVEECHCKRHKRHGFDPWVKKIPWRRAWHPTPVFLPEKSHGQKSGRYMGSQKSRMDMTEQLNHHHMDNRAPWKATWILAAQGSLGFHEGSLILCSFSAFSKGAGLLQSRLKLIENPIYSQPA